MRTFNDKAIEQALEDSGLTLDPREFGNNQLSQLLKAYFALSGPRGLEERWLD